MNQEDKDLMVCQHKLEEMMTIAGEVLHVQGFQQIQSRLTNSYKSYKVALDLKLDNKGSIK